MSVHAATTHPGSRRRAGVTTSRSLVRANDGLRTQLDALRADIDARQHDIAEAELAAESLRLALQDFAGRYEAAVAEERRALARVRALSAHIARWLRLLEDETQGERTAARRRVAVDRARDAELRARRCADEREAEAALAATAHDAPHGDEANLPDEAALSWHARRSSAEARLKQAFRALARRYHPDMVQDEKERARRGQWMVHINGLYAEGDVTRLEALVRRTDATHAPDSSNAADTNATTLEEDVAAARARLLWLGAVADSLRTELQALEDSPTHALWHTLEGGPRGFCLQPGLLAELRQDLAAEARARTSELPAAMRAMEAAVQERNARSHNETINSVARRQANAALVRPTFDPHVGQQLMRLSVEDLASRRVPSRVANWAQRLQDRAEREPASVRLMLLTYVVQLSPGTMPGLERFDELARRFDACGRRDRRRTTLAEALVQADGLVEYAPEATGDGRLQAQLRFRDQAMMQVVPQALRGFGVRRIFAELLEHLGERVTCPGKGCGRVGHAIPLFVVRGLDEVRASVCPRCGEATRSYVLAKGSDVQGVLNAAYLEFDLVQEFTLALDTASVGLQLLPCQTEAMDVRDLLARVHRQLLLRNGVQLHPVYLELHLEGRRLAGSEPLVELPAQGLRLALRARAPMTEAELVLALRFAVQTRFAAPNSPSH